MCDIAGNVINKEKPFTCYEYDAYSDPINQVPLLGENLLIFVLAYPIFDLVHVQRNYRPVQKVPGNELFG